MSEASERNPIPVRLGLVVETMEVAGMEQVVATIARTVDRSQFEPVVFCLRRGGPLADELRREGVEVCVVLERDRTDYLVFRRVATALRERRIDVAHTHNTSGFIWGGVGAWIAGVPFVHTDHARAYPDKWRHRVLERMLSRVASRVVGCSDDTTRALASHGGIAADRLMTIPNGIIAAAPARSRSDVRRELGIPDEARVLTIIGRLAEQKGGAYLLDAVARLKDQWPTLHVLFVGQGPLREALMQTATSSGIGDRVVFAGVRRDIPDVLAATDVYVQPSIWEGLPMVILEAMAAERPIVATAVGGMPGALEPDSAVLVPPHNAAALADALQRVLADEALQKRLGAAARETFDVRFTARRMTAAYEELYRAAVESARRR